MKKRPVDALVNRYENREINSVRRERGRLKKIWGNLLRKISFI